MRDKIRKYLFDALSALNQINEYFDKCPSFSYYDNTPILQDATERNLEIIGEAIKKSLDLKIDLPITNARRIVNTRNKLIHGYDSVDNAEIYTIVVKHLPILKSEIETLLNSGKEAV